MFISDKTLNIDVGHYRPLFVRYVINPNNTCSIHFGTRFSLTLSLTQLNELVKLMNHMKDDLLEQRIKNP
jgi:hypothetical protein